MTTPQPRSQEIYGRGFVWALALMPLIAIFAPRFTGLGPPLIAALWFAGHRYIYGGWPQVSRRALLWSLAFPVLMAASALWSVNPHDSLSRAIATLPVLLAAPVLFALAKGVDEKYAREFLRVFPFLVIAAGAVCAFELYDSAPLYHMVHNPALNDTAHPAKKFNLSQLNRAVVIFILSAVMAFFCAGKNEISKRRRMITLGALAIVTVLVLVATSSQSAQLAFIIAGAFYFLFPARYKSAWVVLGAGICVLMLAAPWLAEFLYAHFPAQAQKYAWLRHSYAAQRMEIWDFVSRKALQRPLYGFGAEATKNIKDFANAKTYWPNDGVLHPHNFAIQIWIEFGALGAALAAAFFADILRAVRALPTPVVHIALALFMATLSIAATGYGLWQSWWLGTFCALIAYAGLAANCYENKGLR